MSTYSDKLLRGDQLLVYSGLVKADLAGKIADPVNKLEGQLLQ